MKLDTRAFRHLTDEDWRVLAAVRLLELLILALLLFADCS